MLLLLPMATPLLAMVVLATTARGLLMLSQRLMLMLVFSMEPMAMVPVLDMLDLDIPVLDMLVMDLAMAVLAMLVLATMARGLLMPSLRLKLILVLDMLGMVVMDLDTVLDMDVPSTVKQLIYTSKSSKVIFLLFSALLRGRNLVFHVRIK